MDSVHAMMQRVGAAAVTAAGILSLTSAAAKNRALSAAAAALRMQRRTVIEANAVDVSVARGAGLSAALLDRLLLDDPRVEAMASGLEAIAELADPIGSVVAEWTRPNGLRIQRVRVPLGVIGIIYESRPNVTADAGALCLKSGNAAILRGGSESSRSNAAIHDCLVQGLEAASLPATAIQWVGTTDRAAVGEMLGAMTDFIDVLVPRGGKSLVARVQAEARVPVIGHLEGNCHVYVDREADAAMAHAVVLNSKLRRTGVCGAAETLLVDRAAAPELVRSLVVALRAAGCEVRADAAICAAIRESNGDAPAAGSAAPVSLAAIRLATEQDWQTEFLDAIIAVRLVDGVDGAIEHIGRYGSSHTESIVTDNLATAGRFLARVDSAIVLHNASTQFADGGEFGMGAEIGISTDRFHARGPVGVEQLTSYKYVVHGHGQVRPG